MAGGDEQGVGGADGVGGVAVPRGHAEGPDAGEGGGIDVAGVDDDEGIARGPRPAAIDLRIFRNYVIVR